jgi:hypothetical protein
MCKLIVVLYLFNSLEGKNVIRRTYAQLLIGQRILYSLSESLLVHILHRESEAATQE